MPSGPDEGVAMADDKLLAERLKLAREREGQAHPFAVTEYKVFKIKKEEVKSGKLE